MMVTYRMLLVATHGMTSFGGESDPCRHRDIESPSMNVRSSDSWTNEVTRCQCDTLWYAFKPKVIDDARSLAKAVLEGEYLPPDASLVSSGHGDSFTVTAMMMCTSNIQVLERVMNEWAAIVPVRNPWSSEKCAVFTRRSSVQKATEILESGSANGALLQCNNGVCMQGSLEKSRLFFSGVSHDLNHVQNVLVDVGLVLADRFEGRTVDVWLVRNGRNVETEADMAQTPPFLSDILNRSSACHSDLCTVTKLRPVKDTCRGQPSDDLYTTTVSFRPDCVQSDIMEGVQRNVVFSADVRLESSGIHYLAIRPRTADGAVEPSKLAVRVQGESGATFVTALPHVIKEPLYTFYENKCQSSLLFGILSRILYLAFGGFPSFFRGCIDSDTASFPDEECAGPPPPQFPPPSALFPTVQSVRG
jgi:hypothetical protein